MRLLCYQSFANSRTLDQLFLLADRVGGFSNNLQSLYGQGIRIYIPEGCESLALLIDPELLRKSQLDYIV